MPFRPLPAVFNACLCFALSACQTTLSEFEQSAAANRPLSAEEEAIRDSLCAPLVVKRLSDPLPTIPAGFTGRPVELRPAQTLSILQFVREPADKYRTEVYQNLPNGGIFGIHLCGAVILLSATATGTSGEILSNITLLLPPDFDVTATYPNTGQEILRRGQLHLISGGKYLELTPTGKIDSADWSTGNRPSLPFQDLTRQILLIDNKIYVPIPE